MADRVVSPRARAAFVLAALAVDLADASRDLVADIATPHRPGELTYRVRQQLRVASVAAVDLALMIEAYDGASWDVLADRSLVPAAELEARYEPVLTSWRAGVWALPPNGVVYAQFLPAFQLEPDLDTAAALDSWCARARDPRDEISGDGPVVRALTTL
jgi:hypothetical protein